MNCNRHAKAKITAMPTTSEKDALEPVEGSLPPIIAPPKLTILGALNYIARVGTRFGDRPQEFALLLETLSSFLHAQMVIAESHARRTPLPEGFVIPTIHSVYSKSCEILKNDPDLMEELKSYIQPITADPRN